MKDFTTNQNFGANAFNVTLLPSRIQPIFANMANLDAELAKFTEAEVSDLEAYLMAVSDENWKIAGLKPEPNADGLSASKKRAWEAKCISQSCRTAAAGLRAFNFARKNPHLRG